MEVIPATLDTAAVLVDEFTQRDGHFFFNGAGIVDVARYAEQLGALIAFAAEAGKPLGSSSCDGRADGDCFYVCDSRRTAEETYSCRLGRLQSRFAGFAF